MNKLITNLVDGLEFFGNIERDSYNLLQKHKRHRIANHSLRVGKMAKLISQKYFLDGEIAEVSGYLHDIGGIFSNDKRIEVATALGIEIIQEEVELPLILHQKISKVLAKEIFNINNVEILNAIECHTTLKANPSKLDMVLFLADKIQWDQDGVPPYLGEIEKALEVSIECAAYCYIDYLLRNKEKLIVVHPWLLAAYKDLGCKITRPINTQQNY